MAWFNISIAAYDQGRGTVVVEADSYEEAVAKMVAGKLHHECDLENEGEYEGHRIVDAIQVDHEYADPKTGTLVAEDDTIPGEPQMFQAHSDVQQKGFEAFNNVPTPRLQRNVITIMEGFAKQPVPKTTRLDLAYDLLDRIKPNTDLEILIGTLKGILEAQAIRESLKRKALGGK